VNPNQQSARCRKAVMSEAPELLSAQTAEQQQAWAAVNAALGRLSLAYGIDPDSLNEPAGAAIEANDTAAGPPHLHGPHHAGVGVGGRPDGSWLASASCDVTVRVWNLHHGPGRAARTCGHADAVQTLALAPHGRG
jgi:hypothetical protein